MARCCGRPSVKGDEMLKTDPASLARHSITMLYTPKPAPVTSPPPHVNGVSKRTQWTVTMTTATVMTMTAATVITMTTATVITMTTATVKWTVTNNDQSKCQMDSYLQWPQQMSNGQLLKWPQQMSNGQLLTVTTATVITISTANVKWTVTMSTAACQMDSCTQWPQQLSNGQLLTTTTATVKWTVTSMTTATVKWTVTYNDHIDCHVRWTVTYNDHSNCQMDSTNNDHSNYQIGSINNDHSNCQMDSYLQRPQQLSNGHLLTMTTATVKWTVVTMTTALVYEWT